MIPKPKRNIPFYIVSALLLYCVVTLIFCIRFDREPPSFVLTFTPLIFWIFIGLAVYQVIRAAQSGKQEFACLAADIHPDEKIRMLDERYRKGAYMSGEWAYLNLMSILYGQKGDYVRALDLAQRAYAILPDKRLSQWGQVAAAGIIKNNEASYLISLGQYAAAEQILVMLEAEGVKNPSYQAVHLENRATLELYRGNIPAARSFIATGRALAGSKKLSQFLSGFLLIEAKCDLAEGNIDVVNDKLESIIAQCTYAPTVWEAKRMKQQVFGG